MLFLSLRILRVNILLSILQILNFGSVGAGGANMEKQEGKLLLMVIQLKSKQLLTIKKWM